MWATTEDVFEQERDTHHATYGESHHAVVEYLQATWLSRKENFVLAWTKRVPHLGHVVNSRTEGKHSIMKGWINVSTGDLKDVYDKISLAIDHQEHCIREQIAYDKSTILLSHTNSIWSEVNNVISHFALCKMLE